MANEAGSTVAGKPTTFVFVAFFQDLFQVLLVSLKANLC